MPPKTIENREQENSLSPQEGGLNDVLDQNDAAQKKLELQDVQPKPLETDYSQYLENNSGKYAKANGEELVSHAEYTKGDGGNTVEFKQGPTMEAYARDVKEAQEENDRALANAEKIMNEVNDKAENTNFALEDPEMKNNIPEGWQPDHDNLQKVIDDHAEQLASFQKKEDSIEDQTRNSLTESLQGMA